MGWLSVLYIYQVDPGTQGTQYRWLMLVGEGRSHVKKRARATGAAQWLPDSGGGPGWRGRLLGGGGLSIVTGRAHNAGPPV